MFQCTIALTTKLRPEARKAWLSKSDPDLAALVKEDGALQFMGHLPC